MIDRLLIANRGEIACRVTRTARRLGIATVAVYTDADADSRHVSEADEAYRVGPVASAEGYLDGAAIIEVAVRAQVSALHPGYGFLSENADFAEACTRAGVVFVGPPPSAIRLMGEKHGAKARMIEADVPVVPGTEDPNLDDAALGEAAARIGYPLVIKPTVGGGGKGMRVVESPGEFESALAASRREARAAFSDDRVLLERYLRGARHIEVQVFADSHGNLVHLFERDCSLQRRSQKIVEEAPATIDPALRQRLGEVAIRAARAVDYTCAGTIEFLVDANGNFYFMEMNTRLQVEHPVTELITGIDLVEWQFRVAAGEILPLRQHELAVHGHAIEVRIYAEDPAAEFLPRSGRVSRLRLPQQGPHVRVDIGIGSGDEIGVHYDPLLAKLIVRDGDRQSAVKRLIDALGRCQFAGVTNNLEFLARLVAHPGFVAGEFNIDFVEQHLSELVDPASLAPDHILGLAALAVVARRSQNSRKEDDSPWAVANGWRLNQVDSQIVQMQDGNRSVEVRVCEQDAVIEIADVSLAVHTVRWETGQLIAELNGRRYFVPVFFDGNQLTLSLDGREYHLNTDDPRHVTASAMQSVGRLFAPMPGRIGAVLVESGSQVAAGTPLVVIEAMKMEHTIAAPVSGTVSRVHYPVGALVEEGALLVAFSPDRGN